MSGKTKIEWADRVWNPVSGCTKVSQGCKLCYAKTIHDMRHQAYLEGKKIAPQYAHPFETVQLMPDRLGYPLSLQKPSRIFVNSVSDLFHEDVPDEFIAQVFAIMALASRHTFQVLTKRPQRMRDLLDDGAFIGIVSGMISHYAIDLTSPHNRKRDDLRATAPDVDGGEWPLPNVWLGVSVENQEAADERIPLLLQTPAAVRFLSCEPLLGPLDLEGGDSYPSKGWLRGWHAEQQHSRECSAERGCVCQGEAVQVQNGQIDWVIVGGESGSSKQNPRPMHPDWPRALRDQCIEHGVAFLFKQVGDWCSAADSAFGKVEGETRVIDPAGKFVEVGSVDDDVNTCMTVVRVGKKRAGRELDGVTYDQYPQPRTT